MLGKFKCHWTMLNKKIEEWELKMIWKENEWISVSWTCICYYIYYNCETLFGSLMKPN